MLVVSGLSAATAFFQKTLVVTVNDSQLLQDCGRCAIATQQLIHDQARLGNERELTASFMG